MDLRIFTEPQQGASFATLLATARATRDAGFSAFFRSDHLLAMGGGSPESGMPGPSESFVTLGAIAALIPDIRLGTLVSSATFRHPSMLAMAAANVDEISGGRLDLGLGAGWFEAEHRAYGIDFGASVGERFDRLTEQLQIITGLWDTPVGGTFSHVGQHFTLADSPGLPKPAQIGRTGTPRTPIIMGGTGARRTPALAARFADEFNVPFGDHETVVRQRDRVIAACEALDRDPATMTFSFAQTMFLGSDDAQVARRIEAAGRDPHDPGAAGLAGTPEQVREQLADVAELGIDRYYLQVLDLADLEHIAFAGAELL